MLSQAEPGFQDMAEDLGLVKAGESFMGREPVWFQLEVSLALWKRLTAVEDGQQALCKLCGTPWRRSHLCAPVPGQTP